MRRLRLRHAAMAAFGLLLGGCASVPRDAGFSGVQALVKHRIPQRIVWDQGSPNDAKVDKAVDKLLAKPLTADAAVQIALLNNRDLQGTYEDLGVAQADLVQAGLLKNPIFDGAARLPITGGQAELDLTVTQDFMDVFTMPLRKKVAKAEFEATKRHVAGAVMDLAERTRVALYQLQAAKQLLAMRQQILQATDDSFDASKRMRKAGNITKLALDSRESLYDQAKLDVARSQQMVVNRRERLNRLMGLWGKRTQWKVANRLPEVPKQPLNVQHLEKRAIANSLDLAAAKQQIIAYGRRLGVTKATALVPSLDAGPMAERQNNEWTVGPAFTLPIPLFDQGQARVAKAKAQLRRLQQRYLALAVNIRSRARAARQQLRTARQRARYYLRVYLPLQQRILNQTQLQFNAMQVGIFRLLFAREQEINAGQSYVQSLLDYWTSRAQLRQILLGRLTDLSMGTGMGTSGMYSSMTGAAAPGRH